MIKDAKKPIKGKFKPSSNAEAEFYRALKRVSTVAGHIIESHALGASLKNESAMMKALRDYSEIIGPWAARQSTKLLEKVSKSNERAYQKNSKEMKELLKTNVAQKEMGDMAMALLHEQVGLIQSIPLDAGIRAQEIAAKNFFEGTRAQPDQSVIDQLVNQMGMSTSVATNRAKLIAITETARANSAFVQARATSVGSTSYIWRTTMDGAERASHRKMNGKKIDWANPPTLSDGTTGHAGSHIRCRCYPDPVLPAVE